MIIIGDNSSLLETTAKPSYIGKKRLESLSDFPEVFSSAILYEIGGQIDLTGTSITVPVGGLSMEGDKVTTSRLFSSNDNYTMFVSEDGVGSGNVFISKLSFTVSGTNSQLLDLVGATGGEGIEMVQVNFEDCTSLGEINSYRQGFELITGRYGGSPELTLSGNWIGGYKITETNALNLDASFSGSIFKAGVGLVFNNRFYTNINLDLPANASFFDGDSTNFSKPTLLQIREARFSRNGVASSGDNGYLPNLDPSDLVCSWYGNVGLRNTTEGGRVTLTTQATTTITQQGDYYDFSGTFTGEALDHFSNPSNGQLKNDAPTPQEFLASGNLIIDGGANDVLSIKLVKWSEVDQVFSDVYSVPSQVLSIIGGRDVAMVPISYPVNLEQDDYVKLQVANLSDTTDITLEIGSYLQIIARK